MYVFYITPLFFIYYLISKIQDNYCHFNFQILRARKWLAKLNNYIWLITLSAHSQISIINADFIKFPTIKTCFTIWICHLPSSCWRSLCIAERAPQKACQTSKNSHFVMCVVDIWSSSYISIHQEILPQYQIAGHNE